MKFLLQKEDSGLDIDVHILKDNLDRQKYLHSYEYRNRKEMSSYSENKYVVPVGDLDFMGAYLRNCYGITQMNPIEVPEILRQPSFLKRDYSIVDRSDLPKEGTYFVKYVSKLKEFSYSGMIERLQDVKVGEQFFLKEGLYQVSEVVEILSEYRCFVHEDRLVAIHHYDGNFRIFPDISLIISAVQTYIRDDTRPKAYTMDVAVIKDRGTAILEIHPWVSVGLYGYDFDNSLPYCYRDGLQWYIEQNTSLTGM